MMTITLNTRTVCTYVCFCIHLLYMKQTLINVLCYDIDACIYKESLL